jgi:hypothetical protein
MSRYFALMACGRIFFAIVWMLARPSSVLGWAGIVAKMYKIVYIGQHADSFDPDNLRNTQRTKT